MNKKYVVFRFYYFRSDQPAPMLYRYNPAEEECMEFVDYPHEILPPGFRWFRESGNFGKHEYLLEEVLNGIATNDYRTISVIRLPDDDPDKLTEDQITYQIVAEKMAETKAA